MAVEPHDPAARAQPVAKAERVGGLPSLAVGLVLAGFILVALVPLISPPRYVLTVLTEVFIYAIFAMSLDLLLGYTGLPSLGHAAFWGLGAYATGIVAKQVNASALLSVPAGVLVAGIGS